MKRNFGRPSIDFNQLFCLFVCLCWCDDDDVCVYVNVLSVFQKLILQGNFYVFKGERRNSSNGWMDSHNFSRERDVDGRTPITMRHRVNRVIDDILDQRLTVPANVTVATWRRRRFLLLLLLKLKRWTDGILRRQQLSICHQIKRKYQIYSTRNQKNWGGTQLKRQIKKEKNKISR